MWNIKQMYTGKTKIQGGKNGVEMQNVVAEQRQSLPYLLEDIWRDLWRYFACFLQTEVQKHLSLRQTGA